ncbi:hypothetical protein KY334_06405 [Candidatus Woesearchaeota archaeon]|nr:hypothetical protein [Candidatus Woesearchaeota archaeon]
MKKYYNKFKDLESNDKENQKKSFKSLEEVLVFTSQGNILVKDLDGSIINLDGPHNAYRLCSNNGDLYYIDGEQEVIFKMFSDKKIEHKFYTIEALLSYRNKLCYSVFDSLYEYPKTLKKTIEENHGISSLFEHNNSLFALVTNWNDEDENFEDSYLLDLYSDKKYHMGKDVTKTKSHNGNLYSIYRKNNHRIDSRMHGILVEREGFISDLHTHNGNMYDFGEYAEVFNSFTDEVILRYNAVIDSICFHPREDFVERGILKPNKKSTIITMKHSVPKVKSYVKGTYQDDLSV